MASRKNRKKRNSTHKKFLLEQLEKKELLDASGLLSDFDTQIPGDNALVSEALEAAANEHIDLDVGSSIESKQLRTELVFVDPGVANASLLLDNLSDIPDGVSREILYLNAEDDGFSQIANALSERSDVSAVHILSHGDEAVLRLGGSTITGDQLASQYADQLATIGSSLSADGDILIYGCDLAGNAEGEAFVERLSAMTGADVAASDDLTGHASLGGDWDLERVVGEIETLSLIHI